MFGVICWKCCIYLSSVFYRFCVVFNYRNASVKFRVYIADLMNSDFIACTIVAFHNQNCSDLVQLIYPLELEITESTDTASYASF